MTFISLLDVVGTKVASFVSGPRAPRQGVVYDGLMHISDWYPTILSAAGLKTLRGLNLDSHNQWPAIKGKHCLSPSSYLSILSHNSIQLSYRSISVSEYERVSD